MSYSSTSWCSCGTSLADATVSSVSKADRTRRVDDLLASFGLKEHAHTIIGAPVRKGLSGGQIRRVSIASQLITCAKILFLDEPTSGLDSVASHEVMYYLKEVAKRNKVGFIFAVLFLLTVSLDLSHCKHSSAVDVYIQLIRQALPFIHGDAMLWWPISGVQPHFESIGFPMPVHINPAEFMLDLVNVAFARDHGAAERRLSHVQTAWDATWQKEKTSQGRPKPDPEATEVLSANPSTRSKLLIPFTLMHRSFIKSYQDIVIYGIRVAMYMGMFASGYWP